MRLHIRRFMRARADPLILLPDRNALRQIERGRISGPLRQNLTHSLPGLAIPSGVREGLGSGYAFLGAGVFDLVAKLLKALFFLPTFPPSGDDLRSVGKIADASRVRRGSYDIVNLRLVLSFVRPSLQGRKSGFARKSFDGVLRRAAGIIPCTPCKGLFDGSGELGNFVF